MKTKPTRRFIVSVWKVRQQKKQFKTKKVTGFAYSFEGTVDELYKLFDIYQRGRPNVLVEASKVTA